MNLANFVPQTIRDLVNAFATMGEPRPIRILTPGPGWVRHRTIRRSFSFGVL